MKKLLSWIIPIFIILVTTILVKADEVENTDVKLPIEKNKPVEIQMTISGKTVSIAEFNIKKNDVVKKINNNALDKVTTEELSEIKDVVRIQSQKCKSIYVGGVFDWNKIKNLLNNNCN